MNQDSSFEKPTLLKDDKEHNHGMEKYEAQIVSFSYPTGRIFRFIARLPHANNKPGWALPNVAVRFYLDERYGLSSRVYTVRRYHPDNETIEVDVVIHDHDSPMMRWVKEVKPGDTLTMVGPRPHARVTTTPSRVDDSGTIMAVDDPHPHGIHLFADDTAVPAVFSILEQWPAGTQGHVWVATDDVEQFAELPAVEGVEMHHLPAPTPHTFPLAQAAEALTHQEGWVYWAAGERDEMKRIRRHIRNTLGLDKLYAGVQGYWKWDTSNTIIDQSRIAAYQELLKKGGVLDDVDDLDMEI